MFGGNQAINPNESLFDKLRRETPQIFQRDPIDSVQNNLVAAWWCTMCGEGNPRINKCCYKCGHNSQHMVESMQQQQQRQQQQRSPVHNTGQFQVGGVAPGSPSSPFDAHGNVMSPSQGPQSAPSSPWSYPPSLSSLGMSPPSSPMRHAVPNGRMNYNNQSRSPSSQRGNVRSARPREFDVFVQAPSGFCWDWFNKGICPRGDMCRFRHEVWHSDHPEFKAVFFRRHHGHGGRQSSQQVPFGMRDGNSFNVPGARFQGNGNGRGGPNLMSDVNADTAGSRIACDRHAKDEAALQNYLRINRYHSFCDDYYTFKPDSRLPDASVYKLRVQTHLNCQWQVGEDGETVVTLTHRQGEDHIATAEIEASRRAALQFGPRVAMDVEKGDMPTGLVNNDKPPAAAGAGIGASVLGSSVCTPPVAAGLGESVQVGCQHQTGSTTKSAQNVSNGCGLDCNICLRRAESENKLTQHDYDLFLRNFEPIGTHVLSADQVADATTDAKIQCLVEQCFKVLEKTEHFQACFQRVNNEVWSVVRTLLARKDKLAESRDVASGSMIPTPLELPFGDVRSIRCVLDYIAKCEDHTCDVDVISSIRKVTQLVRDAQKDDDSMPSSIASEDLRALGRSIVAQSGLDDTQVKITVEKPGQSAAMSPVVEDDPSSPDALKKAFDACETRPQVRKDRIRSRSPVREPNDTARSHIDESVEPVVVDVDTHDRLQPKRHRTKQAETTKYSVDDLREAMLRLSKKKRDTPERLLKRGQFLALEVLLEAEGVLAVASELPTVSEAPVANDSEI